LEECKTNTGRHFQTLLAEAELKYEKRILEETTRLENVIRVKEAERQRERNDFEVEINRLTEAFQMEQVRVVRLCLLVSPASSEKTR
jgi:hypothetical protein